MKIKHLTLYNIGPYVKENRFDFTINKQKNIVLIGGKNGAGKTTFFKAIKTYNASKNNTFKTFANMCIERQLITAIKTSNRQKHMPLNSYLSLNTSAYDDEDNTELLDVFNNNSVEDPLDTITKKEYYKTVENVIDKSLSDFEKQVLARFMKGESYIDIANKLEAPVKSIDNAIQRIRKKAIKNMLNEI